MIIAVTRDNENLINQVCNVLGNDVQVIRFNRIYICFFIKN